MTDILHTEVILYVRDQELSKQFYEALFNCGPDLHVAGMTEFKLSEAVTLGLMPNNGIATLLGDACPHPDTAFGIPRCELYLMVANVHAEMEHARSIGARLVSTASLRDWGHIVGYLADPDGHILAFAQKEIHV